MKGKKFLCKVILGLSLSCIPLSLGGTVFNDTGVVAYAVEDIETYESGNSRDTGVADFFKNYNAVTSEHLNKANATVSPLTNVIGYLVGGILSVTTAAIFLITVIDLLYLSVPFTRGFLCGSKQYVSDEAVASLGSKSGGMQSGMNSMQGNTGGMNSGYGAMGMQSGGMQQANSSSKSIMLTYFKKRVFFVILFAVCSIILTSSILLGTGVNLAQWGHNILEAINNAIPR